MKEAQRPPLTPRGEENLFFERLKHHEVVFHVCDDCDRVLFPLRQVCTGCGQENLSLKVSTGRGHIYSFTTQYRASHRFFEDSLPYTLVLVDLVEGFRLLASLADASDSDVSVGSPVAAFFDDSEESLTVLRFRLEPEGARS